MRGLKHAHIKTGWQHHPVASFTDAWIETVRSSSEPAQSGVASFTDAWIETVPVRESRLLTESHLLQMRGLKLCWNQPVYPQKAVASFTDAWIETGILRAS